MRTKKGDKRLRIAIHGTVYCSNFGDVLFARMFYQACTSLPNTRVDFLQVPHYGVCDFVRKETGYFTYTRKLAYLKSDVLVLMSGGYLGLDTPDNYHALRNYIRSILPVRLFQLTGKPVYIIGVGAGSIGVKWFRNSVVKLVDQSNKVIVREKDTKRYLEEYGARNNIQVTTDTALAYDVTTIQIYDDSKFEEKFAERKVIFLHVNEPNSRDDILISEKIVPALNKFFEIHQDYGVVLGHDYILKGRIEDTISWQRLKCDKKYAFVYDGIDRMLSILKRVDLIITQKLHVGILGCLLEKSVLSFTIDKEKTISFFAQIGYKERCIPLLQTEEDTVFEQLSNYYSKPIFVTQKIKDLAKQNLLVIKEFEREFPKNGKKEKNN